MLLKCNFNFSCDLATSEIKNKTPQVNDAFVVETQTCNKPAEGDRRSSEGRVDLGIIQ